MKIARQCSFKNFFFKMSTSKEKKNNSRFSLEIKRKSMKITKIGDVRIPHKRCIAVRRLVGTFPG